MFSLKYSIYGTRRIKELEESRAEYKAKEAEKDRKIKEYDEWKGQIDYEKNLEEAIESHLETKLPDIKAQYKTVEAA